MDDVIHSGGCHCGAVRCEVRVSRRLRVHGATLAGLPPGAR